MKQVTKRFMSWASILEPDTEAQVLMTSEMPFVYPHIALMPDAHLGKGCAVGAVLPTLRAIMPAAVGVDIGCGMLAIRTQFTASDLPADRKPLREAIEQAIPLSKGHYNMGALNEGTVSRLRDLETRADNAEFNAATYAPNWRLQLGTLGSGNHFIEVSLDEEDRVWLFLHSGSRGVGNRIASHHIKIAQSQCAKWWIGLPHQDLAYLVEGTDEFWCYIRELRWAQHFAKLNREEMMDRVISCFATWMNSTGIIEMERIDCHHNYTEKAHHFGKDVWLSRKGAIDASEGVLGLIPGSMGTASFVVEGKGNRLALNSAPHGAGREYGRKHAKQTFNYDQLAASMDGIEWSGSAEFIDEIPMAYKDVWAVMRDADDLVEIKHTLRQIISVKGD
jgi:tRNA-splicing ligase RtcB